MRYALLMCLGMLVGCTVDDPTDLRDELDLRYHYSVDCLNDVSSEVPLDEQQLLKNVLIAREVMVAHGVMTEAEFCHAFYDVPVYVLDTWSWECDGEKCQVGMYDARSGIYLNRSTLSLAHELLHVWQWKDIADVPTTYWHIDWDKKGYNDIDAEYRARMMTPAQHW